jgi:transient receptor potential cation channel subfamily A protein 1
MNYNIINYLGHDDIVELLLKKQADVHACDINDCTPLHEAARCSKHREDNIKRAECIKLLVKVGMANINALNIRRETPLHIACEYGSSELITCLFKLGADPFATNIDGFNCIEVAIEENNEEVVRFLIEHEHAFDLMRNAQVHRKKTNWLHSFVHHYEADTPMRKLIRKIPKLALRMLDKCSMTVGTIGTDVHKQIFVYEFLDDQYTIREWAQGNFGVESTNKTRELYTSNEVDLVMNNPLFIMASKEAADLMSHQLSSRLVFEKFQKFGIFLFGVFILFYTIFLALFTTIILRTRHPQTYYNLTNFTEFNDALCYNVSQEVKKGLLDVGGKKTSADYVLKYFLHIMIWLNVIKNIFVIIEISRVNITKTLSYWVQIVALLFSFIFIYDKSYQIDLTFRCPTQWQYGAFGVLISWVALLDYVQFMPVIGLYVAMLSVILRKFMNSLPVLIILISGFTLSFHMLFQNFDAFKNSGLSYIKTGMFQSPFSTSIHSLYC